jgi:hypothetical protein
VRYPEIRKNASTLTITNFSNFLVFFFNDQTLPAAPY